MGGIKREQNMTDPAPFPSLDDLVTDGILERCALCRLPFPAWSLRQVAVDGGETVATCEGCWDA